MGRAWAGICGIVVVCLTLLFVVAVVVVDVTLVNGFGNGEVPAELAAVFAVEGLFAVGLVWLTWQLWRSVRALQRAASEGDHGFPVLPVAEVRVEPGRAP